MDWLRPAAAALAALAIALPAAAQKDRNYEPQVGQAGKDVIWVPTPDAVVDRMLRMAQVTPDDYVVDLGAGDGKIAIAAARKFGARALGIEYDPDMARHAQRNVERAGVAARARIVQGDIFLSDFSQATVVTMYLLPALNLKLRPQLLAMRPGTRVVSHSFSMDDWEADEVSSLDGRRAYFWVVPAGVAGAWTLELAGGGAADKLELTLDQRFQKIEGTVALRNALGGLRDARLRGFHIAFAYVDSNGVRRDFSGRVSGPRMQGAFRADDGTEGRWSAIKK
ncbi:MAG: methyltransferase domain-containing protein [Betaproteobacteria bacterium]|nr:methyltransferase domain-containing protein [Betaproteobacteria bacterium]